MYDFENFELKLEIFKEILANIKDKNSSTPENRIIINNIIYTCQQSIGASLDALPVGRTNTARKLNGDLFERLIRVIIKELGVDISEGVVKVPVDLNGETAFTMRYQHDLIIKKSDKITAIGSVKTSSKDRIDKIFIDKFLYNRLTETSTPHFAIFLNDIQRKGKNERNYGVSTTFLPGHFKGYTVKLNPLDGVYYFDIRPNMETDPLLKEHIKTFDHFILSDIWEFCD